MTRAVAPSGSVRFRSAPSDAERHCGLERVLPRRIHQRRPAAERQDRLTVAAPRNIEEAERSLTSAPCSTSSLIGVGMVLGGGPHQRRLAVPASRARSGRRRARAGSSSTSGLPVRAAVIRTVSPSGSTAFGIRTRPRAALRSRAALPLTAANWSGVTPYAVGRGRVGARAKQQPHHLEIVGAHRPVQRRGAVALGALSSAGCLSSVRTAARLPDLTASISGSGASAGAATTAAVSHETARAWTLEPGFSLPVADHASDFDAAGALAEATRDACRDIGHAAAKVRDRRPIRRHDVPVAFDFAAGAADRDERQRIGACAWPSLMPAPKKISE